MKKTCLLLAFALALPAGFVAQADEAGKSLFQKKCSICHGRDGVPKKAAKDAHAFTDPAWQAMTPRETIEKTVTEGKGKKMPAFKGKLTPEEIALVAAHVKTLAPGHRGDSGSNR